MKLYMRIFLIISVLFPANVVKSDWQDKMLWGVSGYEFVASKLAPILGTISSSYMQIKFYSESSKEEDMPSELSDWCKSILTKNNIQAGSISFKVHKINDGFCSFWTAVGNNIIRVDSIFVEPIISALRHPDDQTSKNILNLHEFFLLHEMGHIKSNDVVKRVASLPVSAFINNKLINFLVNPLIMALDKSEIKRIYKNSAIAGLIFIKAITKAQLNNAAVTYYTRYQESSADNFAISKINDVEKIDYIILFMNESHKNLISIIEKPELITDSQINLLQKRIFMHFYSIAKTVYLSKHTNESFVAWLEKNPFYLRLIHWSYDPSHPMSLDRIKALEQRKAELLRIKN